MMLTRSFRQRRSRSASSAADSSDVSTSNPRRAGHPFPAALTKFRQKVLRRNVERVPLKDAADERQQHAILLVVAVEECADVPCLDESRASQGNRSDIVRQGSTPPLSRHYACPHSLTHP
jgi:hypothetical protein